MLPHLVGNSIIVERRKIKHVFSQRLLFVIHSIVLRVLYSVLGLVVREESLKNKDASCRIITTNHITPFDHLAVSIVMPCVTVSNRF